MNESIPVSGDNWIIFADGNMCTYFQKKEVEEEETGRIKLNFLIRPSSLMQRDYDLRDQIDPRTGLMICSFDKSDTESLVETPERSRLFILRTVLNVATSFSRRYDVLSHMIKQQQELIRGLELEMATLTGKYIKLSSRAAEHIKTERKIFEEANKVKGRIKPDESEEEENNG